MALCLLALPIFALLGIFSLKYRKLTKDSLECLFKTVTLRKCESGLDERIKARITGSLFKHSTKTAKFVYHYYKPLTWIFIILIIWSVYEGSVGIYNYSAYGNCNGPESTGFCALDPTGKNSKTSDLNMVVPEEIILPQLQEDDPLIGPQNTQLTIIEFGCYACPYTKRAEPIVRQVLEYYEGKVNIQFKTFIIPHHKDAFNAALAANCANAQNQYEVYHNALFAIQEGLNNASYEILASKLGLDSEAFSICMENQTYTSEINEDSLQGVDAGVIGTPTFFVNKRKIVGPKPFKTFKKIINQELKK
ncbi:MAG: thioredoxin domain-containing protein [Candidatus Woesearchaeota archaeon]|jgi:protein-disulfide isomerase|nr:thioredoxin domain-containing protein [Candidatus Woesearchaeota archaeon]MDP7324263.1 thioredoxin domain-containing protein [Candidatus Woesearchaeota archaeon]|tara:strand:+ start:141 stop:1058 length:918 start_codon:yes stop_codon:yes gene_type:complete